MSNDEFNVDAILDGTLDDLADMPEFKPFPAGTHAVTLKIVDKTAKKDRVNGHPGFEFKMTAVETIELADSSETPLVAGAETSVLYLLDNEIGQGAFKNVMKAAVEAFGPKTNRELLADLQGATVAVVTRLRENKDKTRKFTDLVELKVM